jgi:hypothetical protein
MPIYIDSKGNQKDTSTMVIEYLQRALNVAKKENNQDNITALEEEITKRQG